MAGYLPPRNGWKLGSGEFDPGPTGRLACLAGGIALLLIGSFCPPLGAQIPPGAIGTVTGTGAFGSSGDRGAATSARIDAVYALAVDVRGNFFIADSWNHRIRRVGLDGVIATVAGAGEEGDSGDTGPATAAKFSYPRGLTVDWRGNLYIADTGNSRVRRVDTRGVITTVAGSGTAGYSGDGGAAVSARLRCPRGIAVDGKGNLYVADSYNFRIRKVTPDGTIRTLAGNGDYGRSGDGGLATTASIGLVQSLVLDEAGNLYLADVYYHCVRKLSPAGVISTVAGTGTPGFSGDGGPAVNAALQFPRGLATDVHGNLYIADAGNHRVRKVSPAGIISSVAGTTVAGYAGDLSAAAAAQLNYPYGLATDPRGNVFIADLRNYRVRKARLETLLDRPLADWRGVVNAAGEQTPVSPGSLVTVFGWAFSYKEYVAGEAPLPSVLGGTSVTVGSTTLPLQYVSAGQINAQLPWGVPTGQASVKVNFGGAESDPIRFQVAAAAPGIFQWGRARAVIINQDGTLNSPSNPAPRSSVIVLYATGLGRVTPPVGDGEPAGVNPLSESQVRPVVNFGAVPGTVQFSGLAPGFVGLWQLNVAVPAGAPTGDDVTVQMVSGSAYSNGGFIAIR